jgi:antitoxin HigA-1
MINIVFVLYGLSLVLPTSRSLIIINVIRRNSMIRIPTHRSPTHPGEMLQEEFLAPLGLSVRDVAQAIHIPDQDIHALIHEHSSMTPSIALRLAKLFGMTADFWMNLQLRWDLYHVQRAEHADIDAIQPLVQAA